MKHKKDEEAKQSTESKSSIKDLDTRELESLYSQSFNKIKEGEIVEGRISDITSRDVMVDIGYKSEGSVPIVEFNDIDLLKMGDPVKVFVETKENDDGVVVLSKSKADKYLGWKHIEENCQVGDVIEGKVIKQVKGGLIVDVGVDAFLPGSLASIKGPGSMYEMVGNAYEFKIIKMTKTRRNVVLSRKAVLQEELYQRSDKLLDELEAGQLRKGLVKNITDFGAFVDLDGIDGLLHITDMSWGRVNHPSEILALRDEVEVMILGIDKESKRVSLGLKQKTKNPWENIQEKYSVGTKVKGKVVNIAPYGVFIELEKGIEGLIHVSEMSWVRKVKNPNEILAIGDAVESVVLNVDIEKQRISLGMKQLEPNPWEGVEDRYEEGKVVKGKVHHITDYGAFVELEDGVDGLIHISDISWTKKFNHPKEAFKKGQVVETKVLYTDAENQRISLGLKQMSEDPWPELSERYSTGSEYKGKIIKITDFGMFIELEESVEGLLHNSEIDAPEDKIQEQFKPEQVIKVYVLKIDKSKHQIRLGMKPPKELSEENEGGEEKDDNSLTAEEA